VIIHFLKYFTGYIFFSKTKQRLLFLALLGLFISSFALIFVQSTMSGLQHKLMERSKSVQGIAVVYLKEQTADYVEEDLLDDWRNYLNNANVKYSLEYEVEVMMRHMNYTSPAILHGIAQDVKLPKFLQSDKIDNVIIPTYLALKLNLDVGDEIQFVSPAHVDSFFGDIPRVSSTFVDKIIDTSVPEADEFNVWVRLPFVQNLVKLPAINRVRIFWAKDLLKLEKDLQKKFGQQILSIKSWERENSALVWALQLESSVMIFLFVAMSFLVSLCITSGLFIFFNKIKSDLTSFWILGASKKQIDSVTTIFLFNLSFITIFLGVGTGLISLWLLDKYGPEIMPAIFMDRKIPIYITTKAILISFFVPYIISIIFSLLALKQIRDDNSYLDNVRIVG